MRSLRKLWNEISDPYGAVAVNKAARPVYRVQVFHGGWKPIGHFWEKRDALAYLSLMRRRKGHRTFRISKRMMTYSQVRRARADEVLMASL